MKAVRTFPSTGPTFLSEGDLNVGLVVEHPPVPGGDPPTPAGQVLPVTHSVPASLKGCVEFN